MAGPLAPDSSVRSRSKNAAEVGAPTAERPADVFLADVFLADDFFPDVVAARAVDLPRSSSVFLAEVFLADDFFADDFFAV